VKEIKSERLFSAFLFLYRHMDNAIPVHRLISMVMGSTLLSDDEVESFARMARDAKIEVIVAPGLNISSNALLDDVSPK